MNFNIDQCRKCGVNLRQLHPSGCTWEDADLCGPCNNDEKFIAGSRIYRKIKRKPMIQFLCGFGSGVVVMLVLGLIYVLHEIKLHHRP